MGKLFHFLQQMHDGILVGHSLTKDGHSYAALLDPLMASPHLSAGARAPQREGKCLSSSEAPRTGDPPPVDSLSREINSEPDTTGNVNSPREITLLQLTLLEIVITKVQNPQMEAGMKQKYLDIVRTLVKASIDAKLIFLLRTSDKLMSHMACKSLVSLVHFQLRAEGSLNSSWLTFCSETLSGSPSGSWTAACLWTLTNTVRKILKDECLGKGGELEKLFSSLDGILEGFYCRILSQVPDLPGGIQASANCVDSLSGFLDLLELLVASRSQTVVIFACQRMLFLKAAPVLGLTTSPVHAFVKKKSLVLLKRCILCKAGEDLVTGKGPPSFCQDPHFEEDRVAFSNAILQFVDSGRLSRWLVSEKVASSGGSQVRPELDAHGGTDNVFLRAFSLVLLKALETGVRNSMSEREAQVLLESVMCPLLSLLNHLRSSPCIPPYKHPCMWLSTLFIEQDDDMFEAAKALLGVHLQFKRFWQEAAFSSHLSGDQMRDASTHRNGCNPHCVFLCLLQSIAFDATVLLDFLISSETCFLEYLVRYLKLLIEDWDHFAHVSEGFKPTTRGGPSFASKDLSRRENSCQSRVNVESALCDPEYCAALLTSSKNGTVMQQLDNQAVKQDRPRSWSESSNMSSLRGVQRLVDYESSEDSETEEACLAERAQPPLNNQASSDGTSSTAGRAEILERDASPLDHKNLTVSPPSWPGVSPDNLVSAGGMLWRSVKCLGELQESISRLHRRRLFPYNPAALLKLLTSIDKISRACKPGDPQCPTASRPVLSLTP